MCWHCFAHIQNINTHTMDKCYLLNYRCCSINISRRGFEAFGWDSITTGFIWQSTITQQSTDHQVVRQISFQAPKIGDCRNWIWCHWQSMCSVTELPLRIKWNDFSTAFLSPRALLVHQGNLVSGFQIQRTFFSHKYSSGETTKQQQIRM